MAQGDAGPLERELVKAAIVKARGNIAKAAKALEVESIELRKFISNNPTLTAIMLEAAERDLDRAESIILKGMDSPDKLKRLEAAILVLKGHFRAR